MTSLRIGTRGSALALAQANWVKQKLTENQPELIVELRTIKTAGDRSIDVPMTELGGCATRSMSQCIP